MDWSKEFERKEANLPTFAMLKEFLEGRIQTLYRAEVDAETFGLNEHRSDPKSYNNSEAKGSYSNSNNSNYGKQKKVTANVANVATKKSNNILQGKPLLRPLQKILTIFAK